MKVITRMISDEVYEASNENGNKVSIDMRKLDERKGQSPTELLLSSLAGCGAVDIVLMLKKRKKTIEKFIIETDGTRREETPRYFTDIHCRYIVTSVDVTEEELKKVSALALEKYCSVASSLNSKITFSVQVIRP
jgi:putative redox protein